MHTTSFKLDRSETKNTFLGSYGSFQNNCCCVIKKVSHVRVIKYRKKTNLGCYKYDIYLLFV